MYQQFLNLSISSFFLHLNKLIINFESYLSLCFKATSKNVIPAKAGIQNLLITLDSHLYGSDELIIIRGSLKIEKGNRWTSFSNRME